MMFTFSKSIHRLELSQIIVISLAIITAILKGLQPVSVLGITSIHIFSLLAASIYLLLLKSSLIKINNILLSFLFLCFLSLLFSPPEPSFNAWERLGYYILVLALCSPLINSNLTDRIRPLLWKALIWCFRLIVITSFGELCYTWIIADSYNDFALYHFSGITSKGMALAPICGIVSIDFIWQLCKSKSYNCHFWGYLFLTVSSFILMVQTGSRISLIGVVVSGIIIFYLQRRRLLLHWKRNLSIIIGLIVLLIAITPIISITIVSKLIIADSHNSITYSRDDKWADRVDEFISSPLFGIGYTTQKSFSADNQEEIISTGRTEPGSSWLSLLSQTGILSFLLVIYFNAQIYRRIIRNNAKNSTKYSDQYLLLSILTFLNIHGLAEGWILYPGSTICFAYWLISGLVLPYKRDDSDAVIAAK